LISNHFCDSVGAPEKAGVGGSIPALATNNFNNLQIAKNIQISSREQYAYIGLPYGLFLARSPVTGLEKVDTASVNKIC
jgi:hypothetical protein